METLNPVDLDSMDLDIKPVFGREKLLTPEINQAIREQKRKVKLIDFYKESDQLLETFDGTYDDEAIAQLHKLMSSIAGVDIFARNEMAKILNTKLKDRGSDLRFARIAEPTRAVSQNTFSEYKLATNIIDNIRNQWNESYYTNQRTLVKEDLALGDQSLVISRNTISSLAALTIEMSIQSGVSSGDLTIRFSKAVLLKKVRLRNNVFVELFADDVEDESLERPAYRLPIPRLISPLVDQARSYIDTDLGHSNTSRTKDDQLSLDQYISQLLLSKSYQDKVTHILDNGGVNISSNLVQTLDSLGRQLLALSALSVPPFLRSIYTGVPQYTPLRQSDEYALVDHMRVIRRAIKRYGDPKLQQIGSKSRFDDEGLPPAKFKKLIVTIMQEAHKENSSGGAKSYRKLLRKRIDQFLAAGAEVDSLSSIQWAIVIYMRYIGEYGTPRSKKDKRTGAYPTIRRYFEEVCTPLQAEFTHEDFFDLSSGEIIEGIDSILGAKTHRQWAARRFAYFLVTLEKSKLIDPISNDVAYRYGSDQIFSARSQVIPQRHVDLAIKAAGQCQSAAEQHMYRLILSLGNRGGLRWGELWNLQLEDVQVSGRRIVVTIKRKGKWRPKSRSGNRWVILIGKPSISEMKTFAWIKRNIQGKFSRKSYLMHILSGSSSTKKQNKVHRTINDMLKQATGNEQARFHDLRHTWVNHIILQYFSELGDCNYLKFLADKRLNSFDIPETLKMDGARAPWAGKALAQKVGHTRFHPTTIASYFHFAAEVFAVFWTKSAFPELTDEQIDILTGGQVMTVDSMRSIARAAYDTKVKEPTFKGSYKKVAIRTDRNASYFPYTVQNIGNALLGLPIDDISSVDFDITPGKDWLSSVVSSLQQISDKANIPSLNIRYNQDDPYIQNSPILKVRFRKRLTEMLLNDKSAKCDLLYADFPFTYRWSGKQEYLVFNSTEVLSQFIDLMTKLEMNFNNATFSVSAKGQLSDLLDNRKLVAHRICPRLLEKLRYRDEDQVCVFRLEGRSNSGPQGMQDVVCFLLFGATSHKLSHDHV